MALLYGQALDRSPARDERADPYKKMPVLGLVDSAGNPVTGIRCEGRISNRSREGNGEQTFEHAPAFDIAKGAPACDDNPLAVRRLMLLAAAAVTAIHVVFAGRYGYFQDELYFIACAHRLALGYVDQPPIVALVARFSQTVGLSLYTIRLLPALAAGATVAIAMQICREYGGRSAAMLLAAVAITFQPVPMFVGSLLTTTSFEPLAWTALAYAALRLERSRDARWWLVLAAVTGVALWAKYTIALFAAAIVCAVLFSRDRRLLQSRWFALGVLLTIAIIAPNAVWQIAHGFPMLAVMHSDVLVRAPLQNGMQFEFRGLAANAGAFVAENLVFANLFALPIWIAGLRQSPVLAKSFVLIALVLIALEGKAYYFSPIFPAITALGAAALERRFSARGLAAGAVAIAALNLPLLPFTLPVLPLRTFIAYTRALHLVKPAGPQLIQPLYADELGWRQAVSAVARVYRALPAAQRAHTAIYADSYSYAAALAFYAPDYGLPQPISGSNAFGTWGPHGYDGRSMIAVGATQYDLFTRDWHEVQQVAVVRDPRRAVIEGPLPIYLLRDPVAPLDSLWPTLRRYGT